MKKLSILLCSALLCASTAASAYFTQHSILYTESGEQVDINGVSWSGFQDTNILQGLQSNPFYTITTNGTTRYGMMDLISHPADLAKSGVSSALFKTVRIPIQPDVLYDDNREVDLNKSLSNKNDPKMGNGLFCKTWQTNGSACAKAVTPKEAFWTVLKEMQKQGIRVMVDIHHRNGYSDSMRDGKVYEMTQYQKDLTLLAQLIKQKDLNNVVGIDIFNEPYRLNWFQSNSGQVPWSKVIATAANAVYEANPNLLLFVEGPDSGNDEKDNPIICVPKNDITNDQNGYSHSPDPSLCGQLDRVFLKGNWGEDFKPLLNQTKAKQNKPEFDKDKFKIELIKQGISSDALGWLLGDFQADHAHIVFSPHVYPAEVGGWQTAPGNPSKLRFDWSWGFLNQANYAIVLGEASWKTVQGKAFFTQALMPYLQDNISTHNVYFWAIGYLGDTVTAINPNTGELNIEVHNTLTPFFK